MKKKKYFLLILLFLMLGITASSSYRPVHAAAYVKAADAATDLTSRKNGWVKKDGYYYFYKKGRLICGRFTYKGKGYYCLKNGRRYTGWLVSKGKRYYYNRKNGIMFRNRWATGDKYKYYFDKSGVAIAGRWLNYGGKRYYFLKNSRMATGWNTIGKYQYYFNKTSGAMAVNQWIGHYYVDGNGRKTSQTRPGVKYNASHYSYRSNTLHIDLSRKSVHGVPYWVATVNISNAGQLRSALSFGTYGRRKADHIQCSFQQWRNYRHQWKRVQL